MSRILIVDDEKSIRITIAELLQREGFEVVAVPDATIALEILDQQSFDILITDIVMPRLNGIDLVSKVRSHDNMIQIIIMTGEPTVETATKAVQNSANDYLIKPIHKEVLLKTVYNASRIKTLNDEKVNLLNQNRLYQKNLEEMVAVRTKALQKAMQGTILLISTVIESRDPYTAGHQRRVGNLAATIAEQMKLEQKTVDNLRIIGYIHDVGKIAIPVEILSKPGRLSDLEMEMIRSHSRQGFEMLKKVNLPDFIADTIFQHHERLNGSGYPQGLHGSEIKLETNVLIVADVVEAMMSHRPYRPALGLEITLNELRTNTGSLYQPDVVEACLGLLELPNYTIDDTEHEISFPI